MDKSTESSFLRSQRKTSTDEENRTILKERLKKIRGKDKVYKNSFSFQQNSIPNSLTFNDVLMVPQYSEV